MAEGVTLVVDYGAGNLRSAAKALAAAGAGEVAIGGSAADVAAAARIVLPGVGAFAQCIGALRAKPGLVDALDTAVHRDGKPFLGICVGMQLLATRGHEHGVHAGLDWIPGEVVRLEPSDPALKVPHSGWNEVRAVRPGFADGSAYFVHSYRLVPANDADVVASTDHGGELAAVVRRGTVTGVQFHPEKSQAYGLAFLRDWLAAGVAAPCSAAPLPEGGVR